MAFLAETSGDVWIGTRGGLAHFYAKQFSGNPPPPPVAILSEKIGSRSIVETTEKIVLPHGQNTFEISFAGLSFLDTSGIHFETRLIGLEQEWHSSSNRESRSALCRVAARPLHNGDTRSFSARRLGCGDSTFF